MTARAVRLLVGGIALLVAPRVEADLRDVGTYGATCPVSPASSATSHARLRIDPGLAHVAAPPDAPMAVARDRRTYRLPVRWPAGTPPVVAFVGHDPGSLAVVRALPPGTPVSVLPSEGDHGLAALREACRACRVEVTGTAGARRLGIQAVPAVVRVVEGVAQVTEGTP